MSLAHPRARTLVLSLAVFGASVAGPATMVAAQEPAAPATDPAPPGSDDPQDPPSPTQPPADGPQPATAGATGPRASASEQGRSGSGGEAAASPSFRATPVSAARSSSVSARDNFFAPASITIQVGESVSWRNDGRIPHTVTANGGSFDSGNLNPGRRFSHRFRQAGTFAYFCEYHQGMTGKVKVQGSGSSGGGGGGGGRSTGTSGSGTAAGGGSTTGPGSESAAGSSPDAAGTSTQLPSTGLPVLPLVAAGCGLLVLGIALRGRSRGPVD